MSDAAEIFLLNHPIQLLDKGLKVGGLSRVKVGGRAVLVGFGSKALGEEFIAQRQFLLPVNLVSLGELVSTHDGGLMANDEVLVFTSQSVLHDYLTNPSTFEYEKNIVFVERVAGLSKAQSGNWRTIGD